MDGAVNRRWWVAGAVLLHVAGQAAASPPKLSGPRLGMSYLADAFTQDAAMAKYGLQPLMTVFGWQWETRYQSNDRIAFLTEWVATVSGVEQKLVIPNLSALLGFRHAGGFEAGVGPSVGLEGLAIVGAIGKTFAIGKVNVPVNVSLMYNARHRGTPSSTRLALTFGWNLQPEPAAPAAPAAPPAAAVEIPFLPTPPLPGPHGEYRPDPWR